MAIEVSAPQPCKPGKYAIPSEIARAVKVNIRVINGGNEQFNTALLSASDAQFAGHKAETVYDSSGGCGGSVLDSTTVLPGKEFSTAQVFAVDAQPGELQIALQPSFTGAKAIFVGQA